MFWVDSADISHTEGVSRINAETRNGKFKNTWPPRPRTDESGVWGRHARTQPEFDARLHEFARRRHARIFEYHALAAERPDDPRPHLGVRAGTEHVGELLEAIESDHLFLEHRHATHGHGVEVRLHLAEQLLLRAPLRAEVLRVFDSTFAITYALEIIAVVVAMLGVAGTLVTLVLGTRESGNWNGITLPYDLSSLGAPACYLATDPAARIRVVADVKVRMSLPCLRV